MGEEYKLTTEERNLMLLLSDEKAEPIELASAWMEYLTRDEKEARETSHEEFERYKNNLLKCAEHMKRAYSY